MRVHQLDGVTPLQRHQDGASQMYESNLAYAARPQGPAHGQPTRHSKPAGKTREEGDAERARGREHTTRGNRRHDTKTGSPNEKTYPTIGHLNI